MQFNPEDEDLVEIIEAVELVADINDWGLTEEDKNNLSKNQQKKKKIQERWKYVDRLVRIYLDQYRFLHETRLPPSSLFGEAINSYIQANYTGKYASRRMKNQMRELILGSLGKYEAEVRDSYTPRLKRA